MKKTTFIRGDRFGKYMVQLWKKGDELKPFKYYDFKTSYFRKISLHLPFIIIEFSYMRYE